jgi:hypothetical protein
VSGPPIPPTTATAEDEARAAAPFVRYDWRETLAPPDRPHGTVYGGVGGSPTSANPDAPLHVSGSLTGHILAQGQPMHGPPEQRKERSRRTVIVLAVLGFVVLFATFLVVITSTVLSDLFSQ